MVEIEIKFQPHANDWKKAKKKGLKKIKQTWYAVDVSMLIELTL